jgi:glycosyltransferase involved in cell wall biosynthesis
MIISYQLTDSIHLLGNVENVYEILACGDVFVFPSLEEGFPNSILEAMASGLPVVAYDIPIIREILEDHVTGILVPKGDTEALAGAILTLMNDRTLRRDMGRRAKEQIESKYRVEIMRRSYERVFCEVLSISKI